MKKKNATFYLVMLALFSALVCVLTIFVQIPMGAGYVNFGDALIFIAASVMGPLGGMIAGALGSSLADVFSGYVLYAPFTAVIKGAEGLVCGLLYQKAFAGFRPLLRRLLSTLLSGLIVVFGYFLTDWMLYGFATSLYNFISGPIQVCVSLVVAMIVLPSIPGIFHKSVNRENDSSESEKQEDPEVESEKGAEREAKSASEETASSDGSVGERRD